jgi:hypothetical protein
LAGFTDYTATNILNYIVGKTNVPALPVANVALFTTAPTSDSGVTGAVEVLGSVGYTRQQTTGATWNAATNSSGSEPSVTPAQISNASSITFAAATGNWGTVVAFAIIDASVTGTGNNLAWDYLGNFSWLPATVNSASPGVITAHAHGYSNNDNVVITTKYGGTLPTFSASNFTGLLVVANATTDTFTVTNGGVAVNTSSTGDFQVRKVATQTVNSGTQISFSSGNLVITSA